MCVWVSLRCSLRPVWWEYSTSVCIVCQLLSSTHSKLLEVHRLWNLNKTPDAYLVSPLDWNWFSIWRRQCFVHALAVFYMTYINTPLPVTQRESWEWLRKAGAYILYTIYSVLGPLSSQGCNDDFFFFLSRSAGCWDGGPSTQTLKWWPRAKAEKVCCVFV